MDIEDILFISSLKASGGGIPTDYIARYDFDGGSVADSSGNNYNGTINGTNILQTTNRFGIADKALSFNIAAKDSWITTPYIPNNNIFTVSMWLKKAVDTTLMSFLGTSNDLECLLNYPTVGKGSVYGGPLYAIHDYNYDDAWVHYLIEYDETDVNVYLNAILAGTSPLEKGINYFGSTIGRSPQGNLYYFKGSIDDIRVYDRVLTTEEKTALKDEI